MKVLMVKTHSDPQGMHQAGKVYNLDEKQARELIAAGACVPVAEAQLSKPESVAKKVTGKPGKSAVKPNIEEPEAAEEE